MGSRAERWRRAGALALALAILGLPPARPAVGAADAPLPELTSPVHDLAGVIEPEVEAEIDRLSRTLQAASGDVVVVVTVDTVEPYADIREYAVRLFENHGRGIGDRDKDNGVLIVLALRERSVRIEVGYGLEPAITDGFAGETSRQVMAPEFRVGRYGQGLLLGTARVVSRIAEYRDVALTGVEIPQPAVRRRQTGPSLPVIILVFLLIAWLSRAAGGPGGPRRRVRRWGRRGWSGWSSGVGPFGGSWGGGFGGGSFGGGFGGFGGGRSGGGGGGAGW